MSSLTEALRDDCPKCGQRKTGGRCKPCACLAAKASREKMMAKEATLPLSSPKRCGKCREVKTLADFQRGQRRCRECQNGAVADMDARYPEKKKERSRIYVNTHKVERADKQREFRKNNREWWREWERQYVRTEKGSIVRRNILHKRRAAITGSGVSSSDMVALKAKAKGRCYYCGCKCGKLTFDHVKPLAKGGTHSLDNMVMACSKCNREKSARDPSEYAKTKGMLLI